MDRLLGLRAAILSPVTLKSQRGYRTALTLVTKAVPVYETALQVLILTFRYHSSRVNDIHNHFKLAL